MRKKQVVLMNFSGIYETESFYETVPQENRIWLDCRTIPGTNCYCDEEGERELKERMEPLGAEGIHFLDSGNYHYVTKLWLDQVKEPFDLLVLDHHTDLQQPMFGDILSCGGWIRASLEENPYLNRVFLAGPPCEAVKEAENELPEELWKKVVWIPEEALKEKWGAGALKYARCFGNFGCAGDIRRLEDSEDPVYLSIDKDVLSPDFARTNWDQGQAGIAETADFIRTFLKGRTLIGADICGENPEGAEGPEAEEERRINDTANGLLLETVLGCFDE